MVGIRLFIDATILLEFIYSYKLMAASINWLILDTVINFYTYV